MSWQLTPYALAFFVAAGISALVAFIAWRRRTMPGGRPLALLMLAVAEWALGAGLDVAAVEVPAKILWSKVEYLGLINVPPLFLVFVLEYTHRDRWLTRRNLALLWIIPIITLLMAATNEWHSLMWTSFTPSPSGSNLLIYGHGSWFWVSVSCTYLVLLAGTLSLIWAITRFPYLYRRQAGALLVGMSIPWVGNAIYIFGLDPIPGLDWTPITFTLTGLILAWGIFRFQLLDLAPVARDALIESMSDGVLVLDMQNRVVDINPMARRLLGPAAAPAIGQHVETVLAAWPAMSAGPVRDLVERVRNASEAQAEILVPEGDGPRTLDLRMSLLHDRHGKEIGRLLVWRDITDRKQAEETLQQWRHIFEYAEWGVVTSDADGKTLALINPAFARMHGYTEEELIGRPIVDVFAPEARAELPGHIRIAHETGHHTFESRHIRKDGTVFPALIDVTVVKDEVGEVLYRVVNVQDITERKQAERAELEQRVLAEALRDTAAALNSTLHLDEVLDRILSNVGRVVLHDAANIMLMDEQGTWRIVRARGYAEHSLTNEQLLSLRFSATDIPIRRRMMIAGRPTVVPDTLADAKWVRIPGAEWVRSYAGAPIFIKGQVVGCLNLDSATPGFFTPADAERLQAFADQAAIAIENARLFEEVQRLSITDGLTKVYNRRHFEERLKAEFQRARRYARPLALLILDLDYFKEVNDRYGHPVGDAVLAQFAALVQTHVRETDIVTRYGGEEFAVILPETDQADALRVTEKLRRAVADHAFVYEGYTIQNTCSAGVAALPDLALASPEELIERADQALYRAKQRGRNQVCVA
jgi:diguanylate cyclase (GGDEF)-like protein/PAS domain S-box-containing protein